MSERKTFREKRINRAPEEWDEIYTQRPLEEIGWEREGPRQELIEIVEAKLVQPGRVLDIGCGTGRESVYLAQNLFEVYGVDVSSPALAIAKKRMIKAQVKCSFIQASVFNLPFADSYFDFINDIGCFHHVVPSAREEYIAILARLLKEDGQYFLICFSPKAVSRHKNRHGGTLPGGHPFSISKNSIRHYFSPRFDILFIKESPKDRPYFYYSLMVKKRR